MDRQDQDQERDQQRQPNRIRGPTSALSSFLREHGIRVPNRSRQRRREERQQEAQAQQTDEAVVPDQVASDSSSSTTVEQTTSILYTPRRSTRRLNAEATRLIETVRATSSKRKKRKGDSDDDDDDDDDYASSDSETENGAGPSTQLPRTRHRNQIVFCDKCKRRFARSLNSPAANDIETENLCPSCLAGKVYVKPVRRAVKKRRVEWASADNSARLPSLKDICINILGQYIEDVETFGDIGPQNLDKIARIICKDRKLSTQTIRLFLEPSVKELSLYDCTNVDETGLMNVAHFCPNLQSLKLIYCGQMTSEVLALYTTHLKHLRSIELSGPFLVTSDAWIKFMETFGDQLECFKIKHSFRFDESCIEALSNHCPKLRHLKLSRLVKMSDNWLSKLAKFTQLQSLEIAWPDGKQMITPETLIKVLEAVGQNLTSLALPGCTKVNDDVLLQGILGHCPNLKTLNLSECQDITAKGVQKLFSEWKTRFPGNGLEYLDISRCLDVDDEALMAILIHSNKTLKYINLHSLDKLSAGGLEMLAGKFAEKLNPGACKVLSSLNCSFVRSMDDLVLKLLVDTCTSLKLLNVWGCNQLTSQINTASIRIVGRENDTL